MTIVTSSFIALFFFNSTASAVEPPFERSCAGQIASLVKSAHALPGKSQRTVFSKTTDRKFISLFEELKGFGERVIPGAPPDEFLKTKMNQNFDQTVALARKTAARPMGICIAALNALAKAVPEVCPDYVNDFKDPAKANACNEKAGQLPATKAASEAWTATMQKLLKL